MCIAMVLFTVNDTLVKLSAQSLPAPHIMGLRGIFVIAFMLGWLWLSGSLHELRRMREPLVLWRSGLEAFVAFTFITAVGHMPISTLSAIFLTTPLMTTAASVVLFREQVGWRRWLAILVGFVGMLLVVKPASGDFNIYALLGIASAAGSTARDLITRRIDPATPSVLLGFGAGASVAIAGGAMGLMLPFTMPPNLVIVMLMGAAIMTALGNYAIIIAFRDTDISFVSPFRYSLILWAILADVIIWRAVPDALAWGGIALIVGSGVYVAHRERLRLRAKARAEQALAETA